MIKFFISLYLLTMLMDRVDTLHVDRYWSQVFMLYITSHLDDLDVMENFVLKLWLMFLFTSYIS